MVNNAETLNMGMDELKVGMREKFSPFAKAADRLPPELDLDADSVMRVLEQPVEFLGIKGKIFLKADGNWLNAQGMLTDVQEQPLGEAAVVKKIRNGKIVGTEIPVEIEAEFLLTSPQQWVELAQHTLEIDMDGQIYYCDLQGREWIDEEVDPDDFIPPTEAHDVIKEEIDRDGALNQGSWFIRNNNGRYVEPVVPYDKAKLAGIEMQFIPMEESRPQDSSLQ